MTYRDPRLTSFGYVLWQLSHTAQLRMTEALAETNLTLQQLGALIHLARGDASSTADLARMTLTTPQNMSLTVAKLEAAGYVTRRPHEQHGRIHVLELTPEGARSLRRAVARVTEVEDEMLHGVSASERENLTLTMRQCLVRLQARSPNSADACLAVEEGCLLEPHAGQDLLYPFVGQRSDALPEPGLVD